MSDPKENNKRKKPMGRIISFKLSDDAYNLLSRKSIEHKLGIKPHKYARAVILKSLQVDDVGNLRKSINNLYDYNQRLEKFIKFMMMWMEHFTSLHFASHPEIPADQKEKVAEIAEKRKQGFYKILMSMKLEEGDTVVERILADLLEGAD